jgi:molybdate transport system ATP-binding protein
VINLGFRILLRQDAFTLSVSDDASVEVLGISGPSGAGKTSLLEAFAGLRRVSDGMIRVGGRTLLDTSARIDVPSRRRRIGYVPQDALLFPHLSVGGNLRFGMRAGPRDAPRLDLPHVVETLEIGHLVDRQTTHLSGGERQRVAIARALLASPAVLLLDEPLAGVDRVRRDRILPYLLRIRQDLRVPLVYVTHDLDELQAIADRVLVIEEGRLVAAGRPGDVLPA